MNKFLLSVLCGLLSISSQAVCADENDARRINTAGWSDSPYVTPDGQSLYFMYARYNFFPMFTLSGLPKLIGPDRPGHMQNNTNPYWDSDIYVARRKADGTWGAPQNLQGVNTSVSNCCAMVIGAANKRIVYQIDTDHQGRDLVYRDQKADGTWGELQYFPAQINSKHNEDNPHMSADGRRIYFSSDRPGGEGDRDIWFSYSDERGNWVPAINVGEPINSDEFEDQFWIADQPDQHGMYQVFFNRTSSAIWQSTWSMTTGFSQPQKVELGHEFCGEASMTADGQELFFACGDPKAERIRIMSAQRLTDGKWAPGKPLD